VKGSVSVWLNDTAPGQETMYEGVTLYNSAQPKLVASVGTQDFDAFCYAATFVDSSGVSSGQNANCGIYPELSTTNVRRTSGWHNLVVVFGANSATFSIDSSAPLFTVPGDYSFDTHAHHYHDANARTVKHTHQHTHAH
jgi:hypothetical protein